MDWLLGMLNWFKGPRKSALSFPNAGAVGCPPTYPVSLLKEPVVPINHPYGLPVSVRQRIHSCSSFSSSYQAVP